jgi:hypothetical protein
MKLIINNVTVTSKEGVVEKYSEVTVKNGVGFSLSTHTFDTPAEAKAFCSGFQVAKTVINGLVQSLPTSYEVTKQTLKQ